MRRNRNEKRIVGTLVGVCSVLVSANPIADAGQAPKPGPNSGQKTAPVVNQHTIGDVKISDFTRSSTTIDKKTGDIAGVHLVGKKTVVVVPDKRSHSVLKLHADDIQTKKEKKDLFAAMDMAGNVHYTLTQTESDGAQRVVEGTASHATFRRATQRVELTNPRATLTDPAQLQEPGTLRAGRLVVDISVTPYRYTLLGDADTNDLRFSPRERARGEGNTKKADRSIGEVHCYGFETGAFQLGQKARFEGEDTALEFANPETKTQGKLQAAQIEALLAAEGEALRHAEAVKNVRYRVERTTKGNTRPEVVSGSSDRAVYDRTDSRMEITGSVKADLTSPDRLKGLAKLRADRLVLRTEEPARYEIGGAPERTRLEFLPEKKPKPKASDKKTAPDKKTGKADDKEKKTFAIGTIVLEKFVSGKIEMGKEIVIEGAQTTFHSEDPEAGTATQLQAEHIVATFSDEKTVGQAEVTGNVRFRVAQPSRDGKQQQKVEGTALRATYTSKADTREVKMYGPLRADVHDPEHLAKPGLITGKADTILSVNLTDEVYAFDVESPEQTAVIQFVPRESDDEKKPVKLQKGIDK